MHQDIVTKVPSNFQVLASTSICSIQSMFLKDRCITIQGHPEYSASFVKELITLRRGKIFTEEFADEALMRCEGCPLDSFWFTTKCLEIMLKGRARSDSKTPSQQ
jgi:hypothetical protein